MANNIDIDDIAYVNFAIRLSPPAIGPIYSMLFDMGNPHARHYVPTMREMGAAPDNHRGAEQQIGLFMFEKKCMSLTMMSYLENTIIQDQSSMGRSDDLVVVPMRFYLLTPQMDITWINGDVVYDISFSNDPIDNAIQVEPVLGRVQLDNIDWYRYGDFFLLFQLDSILNYSNWFQFYRKWRWRRRGRRRRRGSAFLIVDTLRVVRASVSSVKQRNTFNVEVWKL